MSRDILRRLNVMWYGWSRTTFDKRIITKKMQTDSQEGWHPSWRASLGTRR